MADTIPSTMDHQSGKSRAGLDVRRVRRDFPILSRILNGVPLVYLDNAATSQKPSMVIDAIGEYYSAYNSNINRGVYSLGELATEAYEKARSVVQRFINAADRREIIFVRGVTEAVNLVAASFGRNRAGPGDEIVITEMEHHSNIVPWQILCEERGVALRVVPINDEGELLIEELEKLLTRRTKLVAVTHVSNVLGTINPIRRIVDLAHQLEIPVFVDGAQGAPHLEVDVAQLGCDFYAFSGHKLYGPTGIGVLYGRSELLEEMLPYQAGGGVIRTVSFAKSTYKPPPEKFEAGTPDIAGAIGLSAAIEYVNAIGLDVITAYEIELLQYALQRLSDLPRVRIIGSPKERSSIVSFVVDGVHPHDVGTVVDARGVAIRSGHHCAQPLMERLGLTATARASLSFYNLEEEIDALVEGLRAASDLFAS